MHSRLFFPSTMALLGLVLCCCKPESTKTARAGSREQLPGDFSQTASRDSALRFAREGSMGAMGGMGGSAKTDSNFSASCPPDWQQLPGNQFRLLNYRCGDCEIALGLSGGSLAQNLNRWRKQFNLQELSEQELQKLPAVPVLQKQGVLLVLRGEFSGMQQASLQKDWAMFGVLVELPQGMLSAKLTGPHEQVAKQHANFLSWLASIKQTKQ